MKFYQLLTVLDPDTQLNVQTLGFPSRIGPAKIFMHGSAISPYNYLRVKRIQIITMSEQQAYIEGTDTSLLSVELE